MIRQPSTSSAGATSFPSHLQYQCKNTAIHWQNTEIATYLFLVFCHVGMRLGLLERNTAI